MQTNIHSNGCPPQAQNDVRSSSDSGERSSRSTAQMNGAHAMANGDVHEEPVKILSQTDQDIIRLIGQHLRGLGLE